MVHYNKASAIDAPLIKSLEEYFTGYFLTIDNSTSLASDIHPVVTTFLKFVAEVCLSNKAHNLLGRTCSNQDLIERIGINSIKQILLITLLEITLRKLLNHNFGGKNISFLNQFRCRNIADNLSVDSTIIHSWFEYSKTMLRSSSKEVATISIVRKELSSREEITLNTIMCLIKVNSVYFNVCLLNTVQ